MHLLNNKNYRFAGRMESEFDLFFKTHGLEKMKDKFLEEDIDTVEVLQSVTEKDLDQLGFKLGEKKKFFLAQNKHFGDDGQK